MVNANGVSLDDQIQMFFLSKGVIVIFDQTWGSVSKLRVYIFNLNRSMKFDNLLKFANFSFHFSSRKM